MLSADAKPPDCTPITPIINNITNTNIKLNNVTTTEPIFCDFTDVPIANDPTLLADLEHIIATNSHTPIDALDLPPDPVSQLPLLSAVPAFWSATPDPTVTLDPS